MLPAIAQHDILGSDAQRGGYLVEIGSQGEQDAVWKAIRDAGVSSSYTSVNDGGGVAYVWIGYHKAGGIQPVDDLIREALKIEKGSGKPNTEKVGKLTRAQAEEIATKKMQQLNANDIEAAIKIVAGTARSMGVTIED